MTASIVEELYCVCRSAEADRFMIGCDNCNEWYHGDCISVTERDAGKIKKFFCDFCRAKDSSLKIVYRTSTSSSSRSGSSNLSRTHKTDSAYRHHRHPKSEHHSLSSSSRSKPRHSQHSRDYYDSKIIVEINEPQRKKPKLDRTDRDPKVRSVAEVAGQQSNTTKMGVPLKDPHASVDEAAEAEEVVKTLISGKAPSSVTGSNNILRSNERCGKCIGCFRNDCGKCSGCKTMKKFGGLGGSRRRNCEMRICVNRGSTSAPLPLPTGHSSVESKDSDRLTSLGNDDALNSKGNVETVKELSEVKRPDAKLVDEKMKDQLKQYDGVKLKHVQRNKIKKSTKGVRATWSDTQPINENRRDGSGGLTKQFGKLAVNAYKDREGGGSISGGLGDAVQCFGPQCVNAARPKSNYCSDACGLKLATLRLKVLMPPRLEQFYAHGGSVASMRDAARIAEIHGLQAAGKTQMGALDRRERQLNDVCDRARKHAAKSTTLAGGSPAEGKFGSPGLERNLSESVSSDSDQSVFCVTCGHEVGLKSALRHMAKCAAKYESQTSYGSSFETTNDPYNLFCDAFNRINQTYCKRLRIICPEHYKESKVEDNEICGYPLGQGDVTGRCLFGSDDEGPDSEGGLESSSVKGTLNPKSSHGSHRICEDLRKRCVKHYKWERTQRAMIALERLTILLKMEELWEEEVGLQARIANRCSVLGLLLHETKNESSGEREGVLVDADV